MNKLDLIHGSPIKINDYIQINQPTLEEIWRYGEEKYFSLVSNLCINPSDIKAELYESGIDYETITDYELFCEISNNYRQEDTEILFGDFDFSKCVLAENQDNDEIVIFDPETEVIVDEALYNQIVTCLRNMHFMERKYDKAGNEHTKMYLIERELRKKRRRRGKKEFQSTLEPLISALVNCEQFKYDYTSVWNLGIYQFNVSVRRTQKIKNYDLVMSAAYSGWVDTKGLNLDKINWLNELSND